MFFSPEPLPVISSHEIATKPLPPVDWVIKPLIAASERTLLYAEWGAFKSWALLHMGLHIALGKDWLGAFPVPKPRGVLYVDEEMSEYTLRARIKRLQQGLKRTDWDIPFWAVSRLGVRMTEIGGRVLLDRIDKAGISPDIIIFEAMRRILVGSENEATDVSAFWRAIEPLTKAGKCVIVSHHMRKPQGDVEESPRYRASGSTDIQAGPDTAWALTRHLGTDSVTMSCTKIRLAEEPKPFTFEFDFGGVENAPVTAHVAPGREQADSKGGRAAVLIKARLEPTSAVSTAELVSICEQEGISTRTAEYVLTRLEEQEVAMKSSRGAWLAGPKHEAQCRAV